MSSEFSNISYWNYILLICSIFTLFITMGSLWYIWRKIKLNIFLKIILTIMAVQNFLAIIISSVSNMFMLWYGVRTKMTCIFIIYPGYFNSRSTQTFNCLLSYLKYEMSKKAAETRILSDVFITKSLISVTLINYLDLLILSVRYSSVHINESKVLYRYFVGLN